MEVILTEDIPKLGNAGDVVRVKPGYGRNYLLPKGIAHLATKKRINQMQHQRTVIEDKLKKEMKDHQVVASRLHGTSLSFEMQSNEEGKLFGSVTTGDIRDQLKEKGFKIDRRRIELGEPIKQVGEYKVNVRLFREVEVAVDVAVVSSGIAAAPVDEQSEADAQMDAAELLANDEY